MDNKTEKTTNKENGIQKLSDDNLEKIGGGRKMSNKEIRQKMKDELKYRFFTIKGIRDTFSDVRKGLSGAFDILFRD